jgi:hypothetical protein
MPLHLTFPPKLLTYGLRIIHKSKKWTLYGKVFCADSEYKLVVSNGPVLTEKSLKKPFFGKLTKKLTQKYSLFLLN